MNLAALILCIVPYGEPVTERVDAIDSNHVLCPENGNEIFCQAVFLEFYPWCGRSHVIAWRMHGPAVPRPQRVWPSGEYEMLWLDGDILRRVRARTRLETYETVDYEVLSREQLPQDQRRQLLTRPTP